MKRGILLIICLFLGFAPAIGEEHGGTNLDIREEPPITIEPFRQPTQPDLDHLRAIANDGDVQAQMKLARHFESIGKYDEATKWFLKAAKRNEPEAQYILGNHYAVGRRVLKNYRQAIEWYLKSAKQGHAGAQFQLGRLYERGKGAAVDLTKAYMFFIIAFKNSETYRSDFWESIQRLESDMTKGEIDEGQRLAIEWCNQHTLTC